MTIRKECLPGNEAGLVSIIDEEGASALRERGRRHRRRRLGIEDDEKGECIVLSENLYV